MGHAARTDGEPDEPPRRIPVRLEQVRVVRASREHVLPTQVSLRSRPESVATFMLLDISGCP